MFRRMLLCLVAGGASLVLACSGDKATGLPAGLVHGRGALAMSLTDAPLPLDSVSAVNVFIERVDARRSHCDSVMADQDLDGDHDEDHMHPDSSQWVTIASPDTTFNLLALQNGVKAFLGTTVVDTGNFRAIRIIIDPAKSTIVLKDGTVLSATSKPPIEFDNARRHGLLVELNDTADVKDEQTTTIVLDFRLSDSLTLLGRSVRDGFFFRPVVTGMRDDHDDHDH